MSIKDWNVLVVEDEADSLELVVDLLNHFGIRAVGVPTAEDAIDVLQDIKPTLIVTDLALPNMSGWGLLEHIQKDSKLSRIPRVAITAYHNATLAQKAIEAGFDAYFAKPLDATSFVRELENLVE